MIRIPVVLRRGLLAQARRGIAVAGCRDGRAGVGRGRAEGNFCFLFFVDTDGVYFLLYGRER